jgi:recombination protein RecT
MSTLVAQNNEKALARLSTTLGKFREKLTQALPKNRNVDQEISSVIATVASSLPLQRCTPESIALAAYDAATLGLPVNKLGLAWLVPFGNEAKLQIGYRGYIQLVIESGFVLDVSAECVYENDRFKYVLGSHPNIEHEPPIKGARGNFIAVYAVARLTNGMLKHAVMSKEQVDHIRAKSRSASNGPWVTDYDEMSKKTVIKRLCKLLPYNLPGLHKVELATEIESHYQESMINHTSKNTSMDLLSHNSTIDIILETPNNLHQINK